jgi:hypothetical protein
MMKTSLPAPWIVGASAAVTLLATVLPARADIVSRESDIVGLRPGQRIYVDDGSCPTGQIKEIFGLRLTPGGLERTRKCVERRGKR